MFFLPKLFLQIILRSSGAFSIFTFITWVKSSTKEQFPLHNGVLLVIANYKVNSIGQYGKKKWYVGAIGFVDHLEHISIAGGGDIVENLPSSVATDYEC